MKKIYVLGMGHMSADKNLVLRDATSLKIAANFNSKSR